MKIAAFGILNFSALILAISHAYHLNGTFYASSVYFFESRLSMIVLGCFGLYCMFLFGKVIKDLFLGPLRLIEREHVVEYSWIMLSETFLAMTIFKNEIDSIFVFAFANLITIKIFHWILKDRIEYMEQVIQLPENFILKIGTLLGILTLITFYQIFTNVLNVLKNGPSMSILFANEYALTSVSLLASGVRFILNSMDSNLSSANEAPFEQRSTILFYLDFLVDLLKLLIYTGFFAIVMMYYGLPIHIIRDLYVTVISFTKRLRDMINYRQIMSSLESRYPNVTPQELELCSDRTCIICREEMMDSTVKRLPCGHFFHFKCLKSWLERQQVCPTCRKSVLEVKNNPPINEANNIINPNPNNTTGNYPYTQYQQFNQSQRNHSKDSFYTQNSESGNEYAQSTEDFPRSQLRTSQTLLSNPSQSSLHSNPKLISSSRSVVNSDSVNRPTPSLSTRTTRLMMSPNLVNSLSLRRSISTSSLPTFHLSENEDEREVSAHEESESLKIAVELERFGRRSRSPLSLEARIKEQGQELSKEQEVISLDCPMSPLSNVKSKIDYVEELMTEHQNILLKLRKIENELIQSRQSLSSPPDTKEQ